MTKHPQVVELFCGIGGFRLAADALGVETVWANDNGPNACRVYRDRFGDREISEGDVWESLDRVPPHDLLTAGFPCQPFSSAGKKKGVRDARGSLFEAIVRILERRAPRVFVLENVKRLLSMEGGGHFATILASLTELPYRIEWRLLNARDFSLPQNRQRVFLIGRRHGDPSSEPEARLQLTTVPDVGGEPFRFDREGWRRIDRHRQRFGAWGIAQDGRYRVVDSLAFEPLGPPKSLREVLQPAVDPCFDFTDSTSKWIANNTVVDRFVDGVQILSNQAGGARMGYTIYGIDGLAPTLTSTTSRHYERYRIDGRYRRLTNVEYARIQGFPDDHCRCVSVYEQYALFGNAVPPPMAQWVIGQALGLAGVARPARRSVAS